MTHFLGLDNALRAMTLPSPAESMMAARVERRLKRVVDMMKELQTTSEGDLATAFDDSCELTDTLKQCQHELRVHVALLQDVKRELEQCSNFHEAMGEIEARCSDETFDEPSRQFEEQERIASMRLIDGVKSRWGRQWLRRLTEAVTRADMDQTAQPPSEELDGLRSELEALWAENHSLRVENARLAVDLFSEFSPRHHHHHHHHHHHRSSSSNSNSNSNNNNKNNNNIIISMSSDKQMTNPADNDVVEQPGGDRVVRAVDAEGTQFVASTTTNDLGGAAMDIALRSGAPADDRWFVHMHNASRMMARGLFPGPIQPPRNMFGLSTRQLALPTIQGQVPGPRGQAPRPPREPAPRPQVPAPQPPQRLNAQRPQQKRARGRGSRGSRGANRGGVQKSGQQETLSSAGSLKAKIDRDPEFLKEVEELAKRKEQETSRAALERSKKATICGNCGKPGHTVRVCMHPAEDGFVHGCPLCNGADHESAQGCKMHWPRRLEKRLFWAIEQRALRPTLAAFSNWMEVFMEARDAGNVALPQSFPWTPAFCQSLMERQEHPWSNFDYVANNSSALLVDPTTRDQDAVLGHEVFIRNLPNMVLGNTGGSPWYPRQPEPTDVTMGEASAPVAPAENTVAPAENTVAPVENTEIRDGSRVSESRAGSTVMSRAGSPAMSRAGSPSLIPPRPTKPADEDLIDYSDDEIENGERIRPF
ncbi:Zinc finger, CCHC-type, partial [Metarhizium majus ARSEF 297]